MSESLLTVSAAELALAQNARFLERCSRLAGVGAWEWQVDDEKLTLSESACELLGLPDGQVPTLETLLRRFGPDGAPPCGVPPRTARAGTSSCLAARVRMSGACCASSAALTRMKAVGGSALSCWT
jgi:hypothetical protein